MSARFSHSLLQHKLPEKRGEQYAGLLEIGPTSAIATAVAEVLDERGVPFGIVAPRPESLLGNPHLTSKLIIPTPFEETQVGVLRQLVC